MKTYKVPLTIIILAFVVGGALTLMKALEIIPIDGAYRTRTKTTIPKNGGVKEQAYLLTFPEHNESASEMQIPESVLETVVTRLKKDQPTLPCKTKDDTNKQILTDEESYRGLSRVFDLDRDGTEELLVLPMELCGAVIRSVSGNGPIYVYQERGGEWVNIGEMLGNELKVTATKTGEYYNIETNYHISACSWVKHLYGLQTPKGVEHDGTYQQLEEREYNYCEEGDDGNVTTVQFKDINGDKRNERITHYYKLTKNGPDTYMRIEERAGFLWVKAYDERVGGPEDQAPAIPGATGDTLGYVVGGYNDSRFVVVATPRQGSGGFMGYKVIGYKDGKYQIVYEADKLYHGSVELWGSGIMEKTAYPLPEDPNCCPTYNKDRQINFDEHFKPEIRVAVERNPDMFLSDESEKEAEEMVANKAMEQKQ